MIGVIVITINNANETNNNLNNTTNKDIY
jgi:hypothetical protein